MSKVFPKIAIGCANFGQSYGFNASDETSDLSNLNGILSAASARGIRQLDTARAYGQSEEVIGRLEEAGRFSISTKIPAGTPASQIEKELGESLEMLGRSAVEGLLLHAGEDLLESDGQVRYSALQACKERGEAARIGVSVYDPEVLVAVVEKFSIDYAQMPINVWDRRFLSPAVEKAIAKAGCRIQARSAYLQGVLLSEQERLKGSLEGAAGPLNRFRECCRLRGISQLAGCLGPLIDCEQIDSVVLGFNHPDQVKDLDQVEALLQEERISFDEFDAVEDPLIIDPRRWYGTR